MEKKLFLLDGYALVFRAHYAFINRPLYNSKGLNTSAISGFTRFLNDILRNQSPSHIAVSFDPPGPTFRHTEYKPYKANRDATPEDIIKAMPYIRKIIEGYNIPFVEVPNYEADDVIGTLAKKAEKEGFTVYMVTPDKDYAQLVSDKVKMYKPGRKGGDVEIIGVEEVLAKWDIQNVDQVIDILGLQGDSVDNIPGIPGIGAKTASKLLKLYGSVEGLIANADKLKGKQKEKVIEFAEQGLLSKRLATIVIDVDVDFDAEEFKVESINKEALSVIFKDLEFRTLAQQVLGTAQPVQGDLFGKASSSEPRLPKDENYAVGEKNIENTAHDYQLISDEKDMIDLANLLNEQKRFSFDTETTGIDANLADLVGLAFSYEDHKAYYIPVPENRQDAQKIVDIFKGCLENPDIIKVGQNIKYDILILKWYGVEVRGPMDDTMIWHYLLEPDLRHKLDYIVETKLNYKMVPIETLIGKRGKNQLSMRDADVAKVAEYAGEDADLTWQISNTLSKEIEQEKLTSLYRDIEAPLINVLADMEHTGVRLDGPFLQEYSHVLAKLILEEERKIYEMAGVKFNIASPAQVGEVLFDRLKIPYRWRKTKSGKYSTDVTKLSELALSHDVVGQILQFRQYAKLKSTYVDTLPLLINPKTGRIHSNFNQARAATGRLSSENPNMQNIPIKNEAGRKIREAFIPRDDEHILLAADYSQIELRLIAHISQDEFMVSAFKEGRDFHRATAAKVFGVPFEQVTADQRRKAKTVNFSIIYGAGATNLSQQLKIKRTEAKELIDNYFEQLPGLRRYMDETVEMAREKGYVQTIVGRKRILRDINSRNRLASSNSERIAINTPVQGSAADMIKIAMRDIYAELNKRNLRTKMILQVHDELVFDVFKPELDEVRTLVVDLMTQALPGLSVPILVEAGTGMNWLEAH